MYDVFFLSYDEPMAELHFAALRAQAPSLRRVQGVAGIHAAHSECARLARTSHFYVVDADNELLDYDFSYKVPAWDAGYVHLWQARNPVNGLVYGWGGVKLFPRRLVRAMDRHGLDMTTSFPLKMMPSVKSVTHFNYAPLETWRSAFREAAKLARSSDPDAVQRLAVWTSVAAGPYAAECLRGARAGAAFARACPDDLVRINDYQWLAGRFEDEIRANS